MNSAATVWRSEEIPGHNEDISDIFLGDERRISRLLLYFPSRGITASPQWVQRKYKDIIIKIKMEFVKEEIEAPLLAHQALDLPSPR